MKEELVPALSPLAEGLRSLYGARFRGLVLYGSYARDKADEGSDVDLLLLLEGPVQPEREILRIEPLKWPIALDLGLTLSILPVDAQAYEAGAELFLRQARRDGVLAA
jgi:uncharacterized protein